jgi:hypothetical protein
MRHIRSITLLAAAAAFLALPAAIVYADDAGATGRVVSVRVNETSSDDAASYRGTVTIRTGSKKNPEVAEYRWGGNQCPGRNVSEENVDRLVEALSDSDEIRVTPYFKTGNGGTKCLTAFDVVHRSAVTGPQPE